MRQWPIEETSDEWFHVTRDDGTTFIDHKDTLCIDERGRAFSSETKEYLGRITDSLPRE